MAPLVVKVYCDHAIDGGFVRIKQGGYYGRCKVCRAAERRARYRDDPAFRAAQLTRGRQRHRDRRQRRRDQPRPAVPRADPEAILAYVAGLSGVPVATLVGPSRLSTVVAPRAVALHLLRVAGRLTMAEVGRLTGRSAGTVERLTQWVRRQLQRGASLEDLAVRVRKRPTGLPWPGWTHRTDVLLTELRACRRAAGLTQAQLARAAGLDRGTISRLERRRRRAQAATVRRLAVVLGVEPTALHRAPEST